MFHCRRLVEAAEADARTSKNEILKKLAGDTGMRDLPDATAVRKQMMLSFNMLEGAYRAVCRNLLDTFDRLTPPEPGKAPVKPSGPKAP
jgi:hypothetical protein